MSHTQSADSGRQTASSPVAHPMVYTSRTPDATHFTVRAGPGYDMYEFRSMVSQMLVHHTVTAYPEFVFDSDGGIHTDIVVPTSTVTTPAATATASVPFIRRVPPMVRQSSDFASMPGFESPPLADVSPCYKRELVDRMQQLVAPGYSHTDDSDLRVRYADEVFCQATGSAIDLLMPSPSVVYAPNTHARRNMDLCMTLLEQARDAFRLALRATR